MMVLLSDQGEHFFAGKKSEFVEETFFITAKKSRYFML